MRLNPKFLSPQNARASIHRDTNYGGHIRFALRFCKEVCGSVALALLLALPSIAQQSAGGVIRGTITDPAGKSVERATVTLTNVAQGTVRTFTTQNDGVYAFTTLEAANYTLAASAPSGFAPWNQSVVLLVGQALNIPVHLVVAENQTSVKFPPICSRASTQQALISEVSLERARLI